MANSSTLSPDSWQYRALNAVNPGLSYLSDALIELAAEGHPVVAGSADLQYSNGLNRFAQATRTATSSSASPNRTWSRPRPAWRPPA